MPRTLLLADDSVTIQKVVGISFANEDVVLLTVDNGDDAIARAHEVRPDAVLADVVMPGKNGYEVCEAIKSDPALRGVPVLLLTGTFEPFDEERARRVGADGHITKPFEAQALVDQVTALFERAAPAETAPEVEAIPEPAPAVAPVQETTPEPPAAETAPVEAVPTPPAAPRSYDFFDDEPAESAAPETGEAAVVDELELGSGEEEAFELETAVEDLSDPSAGTETQLAPPAGEPAPPVEPTIQEDDLTGMGFEPTFEPRNAASDAPLELAPEPDAPAPRAPEAEPARDWSDTTGGRSFDLGFMDRSDADTTAPRRDPLAALEPDDLAGEAVLDPKAGADHDVSVSDLGDPLGDADTPTARPAAVEPAPSRPDPVLEAPAPASLADDSLTGPAVAAAATDPDPTPAPEPSLATSPGLAAGSTSGRPTLSPELEQRLHESIEKIAWESFGDLSERIVRDVVQRVEAVAWEVIPQMAEAMIREEIRRLKDEDAS